MTFTVDIVPRSRNVATTERLVVLCREAPAWTLEDVEVVLKAVLQAIDRVANPGVGERPVFLHGFSWIVEPSEGRVLLALEIGAGAAVAGPFDIEAARLEQMIASVVQAARPFVPWQSSRVH